MLAQFSYLPTIHNYSNYNMTLIDALWSTCIFTSLARSGGFHTFFVMCISGTLPIRGRDPSFSYGLLVMLLSASFKTL